MPSYPTIPSELSHSRSSGQSEKNREQQPMTVDEKRETLLRLSEVTALLKVFL